MCITSMITLKKKFTIFGKCKLRLYQNKYYIAIMLTILVIITEFVSMQKYKV